jgi:GrpB-like predicted nucleotidyltransferase (UPF0157 family)
MKNKQIEEIKDCIDSLYGCDCAYYGIDGLAIASALYDKDYRKASEVAKQIFAEIEEIFGVHLWLNATPNEYEDYKELKKKYTESEKDDGTDGISS